MRWMAIGMCLLVVGGCKRSAPQPSANQSATNSASPVKPASLLEARRGFQTKLLRQERDAEAAPQPPANLFRLVRYDAPPGKLAAYLSVDPKDGKKRPAIVWLFGGFSNGIGETAWEAQPPENDQSASAFRNAGILMMYPALRGGSGNPGSHEAFFGEVDDVLAAADFLARQEGVDPQRLYLGGHSTGGTLALLVAAATNRFRAVFSLGPVEDPTGYGPTHLPFDASNPRETQLRAPIHWLDAVACPTLLFEGVNRGNIESLNAMARATRNPLVRFHPVKGADHFSLIQPVTRVLAAKVLRDEGATTNIVVTEAEVTGGPRR